MTIKATIVRLRNKAASHDNISADIGLLVIRVVFGGVLAGHGAQKLFGWFDGPGWYANNASFASMDYNPGVVFGPLAGLSELVGGLMLLLGLLSPLAAAIVLGTMINVIVQMFSGGLFSGTGYEMGLLWAAVAVAVAFTGPGRFSLDHSRPWARHGIIWAVAAIALAVLTAVLALILRAVL